MATVITESLFTINLSSPFADGNAAAPSGFEVREAQRIAPSGSAFSITLSANPSQFEYGIPARLNRARDLERRKKLVNALAMQGERPARQRNSWLKTVGKYPENHPVNRMFDKGYELRQSDHEA